MKFAKLLFLFVVTVGLVGCTGANPRFCEVASDCGVDQVCDSTGVKGTSNLCLDTTQCTSSQECPDEFPSCSQLGEGLTCTFCTSDNQCASRDPQKGVCNDDGSCGGCNTNLDCPSEQPICSASGSCGSCDQDSQCDERGSDLKCTPIGTCAACFEHSDCPGAICDGQFGRCVDPNTIAFADEATGTGGNCGDQDNPCRDLDDTLSFAEANALKWVRVKGTFNVNSMVLRRTTNIVGVDNARVNGNGAKLFSVVCPDGGCSEDILVRIEGLRMDSDLDVLSCDGTGGGNWAVELNIWDAELIDTAERGIASTKCALRVARSSIQSKSRGGIDIRSGFLEVRNTVFRSNGLTGAGGLYGAIAIGDQVTFAKIEFSTFSSNVSFNNDKAADIFSETPNSVQVDSCIFDGSAAEQVTNNSQNRVSVAYSFIDDPNFEGDNNITTGASGLEGDLSLSSASQCLDAANPNLTRGADRLRLPGLVGASSDLGAFERQ